MRKIWLLLALAVLLSLTAWADTNSTYTFHIDLEKVELAKVLNIYQNMANLDLDIAPEIQNSDAKITFHADQSISNEKVCTALKKALEEQSDIIITKTDDKHAKVTLKEKKDTKPADH